MAGWVFTQLGGPGKVLTLQDWAAPFGRPRKEAVVRDAVETREAEVYYPGNDEPTVHDFGSKYSPWDIHGYFRDKDLGPSGAMAKVEEVKAFVRDRQRVRVTWDDIVSIVGRITKFDPGRESRAEVEWKMTIKVYSDDFAQKTPQNVQKPQIQDYTSQISQGIQQILAGLPPQPKGLDSISQDPLGAIDSLVSTVTGAVGSLTDVANGVTNFEQSTVGELNRLGSAVTQVRSALSQIRDAFSNLGPDTALVYQRADNSAQLFDAQTSVENQVRAMLASTSDVLRAILLAKLGRVRTTYTVRGGDTWESIAIAQYGSPSRAGDLQLANDSVGRPPQPGVTVKIPA